MRRLFAAVLLAWGLAGLGPSVQAQAVGTLYNAGGYYSAPGSYGMTYGYPAMGFPRTYSVYSSPYGAGYGYGYAPYSFLPGYGVGLWRPGFTAPGYTWSGSYNGMFPIRYWPTWNGGTPWVGGYGGRVGVYAPGLGPPSFYGW